MDATEDMRHKKVGKGENPVVEDETGETLVIGTGILVDAYSKYTILFTMLGQCQVRFHTIPYILACKCLSLCNLKLVW